MIIELSQSNASQGVGMSDAANRSTSVVALATSPAAVATPRAVAEPDPRRWRTLPVLLSAMFMAIFDYFVVNVAAPSLEHDLHATDAGIELVVGGYGFAYASGLITGGR